MRWGYDNLIKAIWKALKLAPDGSISPLICRIHCNNHHWFLLFVEKVFMCNALSWSNILQKWEYFKVKNRQEQNERKTTDSQILTKKHGAGVAGKICLLDANSVRFVGRSSRLGRGEDDAGWTNHPKTLAWPNTHEIIQRKHHKSSITRKFYLKPSNVSFPLFPVSMAICMALTQDHDCVW